RVFRRQSQSVWRRVFPRLPYCIMVAHQRKLSVDLKIIAGESKELSSAKPQPGEFDRCFISRACQRFPRRIGHIFFRECVRIEYRDICSPMDIARGDVETQLDFVLSEIITQRLAETVG